jgi:PKD repeat protein
MTVGSPGVRHLRLLALITAMVGLTLGCIGTVNAAISAPAPAISASATAGTTVTLPAWAPLSGELLLVSVALRDESRPVSVSGNGLAWQQVADVDNVQGQGGVTVYRAQGTSPAAGAITVTISGNSKPVVVIAQRFAGVDAASPVEAFAANAGPPTDSADMQSVATASDGTWVVGAGWHRSKVFTPPAGETSLLANRFAGSGGDVTGTSLWYQGPISPPGSTQLGATGDLSAATDWAMVALVLKPAGGGGPPGGDPPVANFSGNPRAGQAPLSVTFSDLSTGSPSSWTWDFDGNGTTDSTLQNPTALYASPGTYSVTLTAGNANGFDNETKTGYVTVTAPSGGGGSPLVFNAEADSYVRSSSPTQNYGTKKELRVRGGSTTIRSYLRFTVTGLSGPPVTAKVRLTVVEGSVNGGTVYPVSVTSWTESGSGGITWSNAPPVGSPTLASAGAVSTGAVLELDLGGIITDNGTYSVAITSTSSDPVDFSSREGNAPPQLVLVTQASPDPVISAAGDIACDPTMAGYNGGNGTATDCRQKATSDLLVGAGLAKVLALGDNQYLCGGYDAFLQSYEPTWGRVKSITRPVPGNHEYYSPYPGSGTATDCAPGAAGYYAYFGAAAGDPATGYYSFDVGAWHLVALNSNCAAIGGCGAGSAQEQWLRADLAAHPAACTLAYWHHPRFSSGGEHGSDSSLQALWQALYDANADIVLSGHDHDYERFAPQTPAGGKNIASGIREFVVGTGGVEHRPFGSTVANSEVRNADTFGVLQLTLHTGSYDWEFVPEAGKTFTDAGSGPCH